MESEITVSADERQVVDAIINDVVGEDNVLYVSDEMSKIVATAYDKGYNLGWDLGYEAGITGAGTEDDDDEDDEE